MRWYTAIENVRKLLFPNVVIQVDFIRIMEYNNYKQLETFCQIALLWACTRTTNLQDRFDASRLREAIFVWRALYGVYVYLGSCGKMERVESAYPSVVRPRAHRRDVQDWENVGDSEKCHEAKAYAP